MRVARRADEFGGYHRLRLVDLPKPAASDGKSLAANDRGRRHAPSIIRFSPANTPSRRCRLVLGNEGAGVVVEGRRDGLSGRFTCDVHRAVWRPRGRSLQRVARRTEGESLPGALEAWTT